MITSCKKDEDKNNPSELGGETNIPINTVGNNFSSLGTKINGTYVDISPSIEIINSADGVNTIRIIADLSQVPQLSALNSLIPDELKDDQGRINFDAQVKITSEGWLDYANADKAPQVAVKYDSKVGDEYNITKKNGDVLKRKVTQKSTTDDYAYGFYMIKTITVEQETTYPGFSKYIAKFNHKFGLVGLELIAEDGSTLSTQFVPDEY